MHEYAVEEVEIAKIRTEGQELRDEPDDDDIIELAADIQRRGLLQLPGVEKLEDGTYQLLWGRRRCTAYLRLRRETIPCRVYQRIDDSVKTIALVENLHRRNLTIDEEVRAVNYLHNDENLSVSEIMVRLSKSRPWVMTRLSIPNMPIEVRDAVLGGKLAVAAAEEISTLQDAGARKYAIAYAASNQSTVNEVRSLVEAIKAAEPTERAIEEAVRAAEEAMNSYKVFVECALCGKKQEPQHVRIIRVCLTGCDDVSTRETGVANG